MGDLKFAYHEIITHYTYCTTQHCRLRPSPCRHILSRLLYYFLHVGYFFYSYRPERSYHLYFPLVVCALQFSSVFVYTLLPDLFFFFKLFMNCLLFGWSLVRTNDRYSHKKSLVSFLSKSKHCCNL